MITVIHGDDTASSRNYFISERQKVDNPVTLDGKKLDITKLAENLQGDELFFETKTIFIEELLSGRKKSKELDELIDQLLSQKKKDIIIWEGKDLSKTSSPLLKAATLKAFSFPKSIFSFLDSMRPGNKEMLFLFHKSQKESEVEVIFALIIRQFRLLLAVSQHVNAEQISEIKRLAPWQLQKLKRQAKHFSSDRLKKSYQTVFQIDLNQKTGAAPLSLTQAIDIFLADL